MRRFLLVALTILSMLVAVSLASAQPGELDLAWFTIDGGGTSSAGGGFALSGTIGQPDAGSPAGGIYALQGGLWGVTTDPGLLFQTVYLPLIQK